MSRLYFLLILALLAISAHGAYSQSDFQGYVSYPVSQEAKTIAVGDLNGDGRDDAVVTAWPSGLYVFYQHNDGSLAPPIELMAPTLPFSVAIGDLNADARLDLAVGGASGQIYLYCQDGQGALQLSGWCNGYGLVNSLVIDDFNGDGRPDIADTSLDLPVVLVSLQASDATFDLPTVYDVSSTAHSICAWDYNADGRRDIAALVADQVCCLTGSPDGFNAPRYAPAMWSHSLATGDVTGDGLEDLVFTVATNQPEAALGVISPNGSGLPESATLYPVYDFAQPLVLVDVNGDGRKDVVTAHGGYEAISVHLQGENGGLGAWTAFPAPYCNNYESGAIAAGDLNSDGLPDVAIADWWNGLTVLLHTPASSDPPADTTPPVCAASVAGVSGRNGWFMSAVTVTVSAEDNEGGSGVKEVFFTQDGSAWSPYSSPLVISTEGSASIGYCAEDNADNRSEPQWTTVRIDTVPPRLNVEPSITTIWPPTGGTVRVPVTVRAADVTSGVSELRLAVNDEYGMVQWESAIVPGSSVAVPLIAWRRDGDADGRKYTLLLTGIDAAGNTATASAAVTVPRSKPKKPK